MTTRPFPVKLTLDAGGKTVTRTADTTRAVGFTVNRLDTGMTLDFTLTTDGIFRLELRGETIAQGTLAPPVTIPDDDPIWAELDELDRQFPSCGDCGNPIAQREDPTGHVREWAETGAWNDERDFQCGLSPDGRHAPAPSAD